MTLSPPLLCTDFCGEQKRAALKSSNQDVARANIYSNLDEHDELRLSVDPGLATHQQMETVVYCCERYCTPTRSALLGCRQKCTAPGGCRTRTLTARRPSTHCLPPPSLSKQAAASAAAATAPPLCASSREDLSPSTTSKMVCLPPSLPASGAGCKRRGRTAREPGGRKCRSRARTVSVEPRLRGTLAARIVPTNDRHFRRQPLGRSISLFEEEGRHRGQGYLARARKRRGASNLGGQNSRDRQGVRWASSSWLVLLSIEARRCRRGEKEGRLTT
jgi:hypothetical protein